MATSGKSTKPVGPLVPWFGNLEAREAPLDERSTGSRRSSMAAFLMTADDKRERAAIYLSLHRGEDDPALDVQLEGALRETERAGRDLHAVYGDVAGPLNPTRRRQVARLLELVRTRGLPASVGFETREPSDRDFLGQRARAHGFAISLGPKHVAIETPSWNQATDAARS